MRGELIALLIGFLTMSLNAAAALRQAQGGPERGRRAAENKDALGDPLPPGALQRLGTLRLKYGGGVSDFCYLPDGRVVIAVGDSLEIWDMARGEVLEKQKLPKASPRSLVLRRDGQVLLMADTAGDVLEWNLTQKKELRRWKTGQQGLRFACYSPDEKRALTTGHLPPTLKEWDLATGKELRTIDGKMAYFQKGIYSADGKTALVGGGYEDTLEQYDLQTGELLGQWCRDYCVYNMVLSADGQRLLAGTRSRASEWQVAGHKLLREFKGHHGGAVTSEAYCPQEDQLLTGSRDGSIRRWNRLTGEILLRWFPHTSFVTNMKVSPDGRWVLSFGEGLVCETSLETGRPRLTWDRHSASVEAVAFLPSGQQAISGSSDGTLRIWDIASGKTVLLITGANLGAYCIAVSPDGRKVAAGCKDGVVREFETTGGTLLRELTGHLGFIRSVKYTHKGDRLLSSADDGAIRVWAPGSNEGVARLEGHRGGVLCIAVSPDDRFVLSCGRDATVRLWELTAAVGAGRGAPLRTFEGHRGYVECVTFTPDGKHALSAGRDGRVLQWDLESGKIVGQTPSGGWIRAMACTPDGDRVFVGAGTEIVGWDLKTGQKAGSFSSRSGGILALAVSPDGARLLSGSSDTTLLLWPLR